MKADLQTDEKTPETKELLNTEVMQGSKMSRHADHGKVGNALSSHIFAQELSMRLK